MPSPPLDAAALRGLGEPKGSFLVVDPGKRTGTLMHGSAFSEPLRYGHGSLPLDGLAAWLGAHLVRRECGPIAFVVCEDYTQHAGPGRSDAKMPSSQGIGMCRTACEWTDTPLFLVPPGCKRAGHQALDAAGRAAYDACRNDHERDVVAISGYVLREMRRPS